MEREIRLDKALRYLINNKVKVSDFYQYLNSVFPEIPSNKLRDDETTAIIEILFNDKLIERSFEHAGVYSEDTKEFYELTLSGREFILNKGYVLETYLTEIKDKQDKLPNPDSLLFEFDKEVALEKASAKDALLLSVAQSGSNGLIYENLEIIFATQIFSGEWRGELFSNYLLQYFVDNTISKVKITDRGKRLLDEGGYTILMKNYLSNIERDEFVKIKQAETIDFNHQLAELSLKDYVSLKDQYVVNTEMLSTNKKYLIATIVIAVFTAAGVIWTICANIDTSAKIKDLQTQINHINPTIKPAPK